MQEAHARIQGPLNSAGEDEVDQLTETTPAPNPAPKRRKTNKKAQQSEVSAGESPPAGPSGIVGAPASPPGTSLPELAAVASSIRRAPTQATAAVASAGVPSPASGHTHSHTHGHTLTGPHHHHHAPVVRPGHVHTHSHTALAHNHSHLAHHSHNHPFPGTPINASTGPAVARHLPLVSGAAPSGALSLRDLSAFRDGLREELGAMREAVGRMERFVARGDHMLGLIEGALLAGVGQTLPVTAGAGPSATGLGAHGAYHHHHHHAPPAAAVAAPVPSVPADTQAHAGEAGEAAAVGATSAAPALARSSSREETTQQDLDEYLRGLPEMAAVPLPPRAGNKRAGGSLFPLGAVAGVPAPAPTAVAAVQVGEEDHEMKVEPEVEQAAQTGA